MAHHRSGMLRSPGVAHTLNALRRELGSADTDQEGLVKHVKALLDATSEACSNVTGASAEAEAPSFGVLAVVVADALATAARHPHHAARLMEAVLEAWPDANIADLYNACCDASPSEPEPWRALQLEASADEPVRWTWVRAAAVLLAKSMFRVEDVDVWRMPTTPASRVPISTTSTTHASLHHSAEAMHLWALTQHGTHGDLATLLAATFNIIETEPDLANPPPVVPADAVVAVDAVAVAVRKSQSRVNPDVFARAVLRLLLPDAAAYGRRERLVQEMAAVMSWPDLARLLVLLRHNTCFVTALPVGDGCTLATGANAEYEQRVLRSMTQAQDRAVESAKRKLNEADADGYVGWLERSPDVMLGKALEVHLMAPRFGDDGRLLPAPTPVIDLCSFEHFAVNEVERFGRTWTFAGVIKDSTDSDAENESLAREHLRFLIEHRPGVLAVNQAHRLMWGMAAGNRADVGDFEAWLAREGPLSKKQRV